MNAAWIFLFISIVHCLSIHAEKPTLIDTVYASLGKSFSLAYNSTRSIEYCLWRKITRNQSVTKIILPKSINSTRLKSIAKVEGGTCILRISEALEASHLGIWQCIVAFSSTKSNLQNHDVYFVSVRQSVKPNPPKILNKENFQSIVANSLLSVRRNNNTLNLTCCIENGKPPPKLSFFLDAELKAEGNRNKNDSQFCISWMNTFHLDDYGKVISCKAEHIDLEIGTEEAEDRLRLNILYPPTTIIDENVLEKEIVSQLFSPDDNTTFSFKFTSNPEANFTWLLIGDSNTNELYQNIDNTTLDEKIYINLIKEKTWEVKLVFKNSNYTNSKRNYRIELTNELGSTFMDFSIMQIVYAISAKLDKVPKVVSIPEGVIKSISCCILRVQSTSQTYPDQINVSLKKDGSTLRNGIIRNDTKPRFCYSWSSINFGWVDNNKILSCDSMDLSFDFKLTITGIIDSEIPMGNNNNYQLDMLSAPRIIPNGKAVTTGQNVVLDYEFDVSLELEFPIEFTGNPMPSVSFVGLLTKSGSHSRLMALNPSTTVKLVYQKNTGTGTLIFKPEQNFMEKFFKNENSNRRVSISLGNKIGNTTVQFYIKFSFKSAKTETAQATTISLSPIDNLSTNYSVHGTSTNSDAVTLTTTPKEILDDKESRNDEILTTVLPSTNFDYYDSTYSLFEEKANFPTQDQSDFDKTEPSTSEFLGTTDVTWSLIFETTDSSTTEYFDLKDGFFADAYSDSTSSESTTSEVLWKELTPKVVQKPIILNDSLSSHAQCESTLDTNVTVRFVGDASLNASVTWNVLTENNTYVPIFDNSSYKVTTEQKDSGEWETTLRIGFCNKTLSEVSQNKLYFLLNVTNDYGSAIFRAIIEKRLENPLSSLEKSSSVVLSILIPCGVALVLILIVAVLVAAKRGHFFYGRRSKSWFLTNDINIQNVY